ncbi:aminotransferase class V-fold PLP-dependent enzyme [Sporomusa sphaeroides]|uniref:aminotransferase class V-fold PLP-dependent enzyme n=1 Tax=Sporomusa sphaeroides TaxID=47679 RepID=UPI002B9C2830|nr:aminotransferase class V-fold PLP-dependent enzyme [Sporomusa sphaeroides]HML32018.1 aminotransferase class V-fold PLP-dependent enzyme [Sporomusa sphaeroides]
MSIYLDNAATSYPKPDLVADSVYHFMKHIGVSVGRGSYNRAQKAGEIVYETRKLLCQLFNHSNPEHVVFMSNVTEAINLAIRGIVTPGGHVITSSIEHNAVWRCLKMLERDYSIQISPVLCDSSGTTDPETIQGLIRPNTQLIVFTHASNVLGTIQPIRQSGTIARRNSIPFLVDSAQTAGAYPIDMQADCIDILAFTGHKSLLGPMGTGGLVVKDEGMIRPQKAGGTGRDSFSPYQPEYLPDCLEAGTFNGSGIAGLGAAVKYILGETVQAIRNKEQQLTDYALKQLKCLDKVILYGPGNPEKMVGVISFNVSNIPAVEIAYALDEVYGIMVRAGLHCAPTAHRIIGTEQVGTVRISLGYFNQEKDIDLLVAALSEILSKV